MTYIPEDDDKDAPFIRSRLTMREWTTEDGLLVVKFHYWHMTGATPFDDIYAFKSASHDFSLRGKFDAYARTKHLRTLRVSGGQDAVLKTVLNPARTWGSDGGRVHLMELQLMPRGNLGAAAGESIQFTVNFPNAVDPLRLDGFWAGPLGSLVYSIPTPGGQPQLIVPTD